MGNIESEMNGHFEPVNSLNHRLHSLEETLRSIEAAHQDAQSDHFPAPDATDTCVYGARLACRPGVRVILGPVVGEVNRNSAVILLEVNIAPGLGPTARVSCHVSLTDDSCPRGRLASTISLNLPSRRPRAFRIGSGTSTDLWPGRSYTACFGGVCVEDARTHVARFRTLSESLEPRAHIIAMSGDRPDRLAPGEPSLWPILHERITSPSKDPQGRIDIILHAGGQAWMGDAFESARELLRQRASDPLLCQAGGWREALEEATERLREAVRRAWNLPDKRAVLSSVSNLMLCGEADIHPDFGGNMAYVSSSSRGTHDGDKDVVAHGWTSDDLRQLVVVGGINGKRLSSTFMGKALMQPVNFMSRQDAMVLKAAIRACRRVFWEYQGQLLWKATSFGRAMLDEGNNDDTWADFDAEEKGVEQSIAEERGVNRDVVIKERKVVIAEEALRRAKAAGTLSSDVGRRAAEDSVRNFRKELRAAKAARAALTRREAPAATSAAAKQASQGAFLDLGGSIGIILLDTVWARTAWDGAIRANAHEVESSASGSFEGKGVQQISPRAWQNLEFELGRDSEFRLLIVAVRFGVVGERDVPGEVDTKRKRSETETNVENVAVQKVEHSGESDDRIRLLDRLFSWKTGEVWREVVLICGAEAAIWGNEGLRSACEIEITDSKHPGCVIRQLSAGPITDDLGTTFSYKTEKPVSAISSSIVDGRFCYAQSRGGASNSSDGSYASEIPDEKDDSLITPNVGGMSSSALSETFRQRAKSPQAAEKGSVIANKGVQAWADNQSLLEKKLEFDVSTDRKQDKKCSYLEIALDGGLSPAAAIAAGMGPVESARGIAASVSSRVVTVSFVGALVVLGPVVGRVTQSSAIVLVEVASKAPVACVLTDGVSGGHHRQMCLMFPGRPHAFFFDALEESRHYTITLDGVQNANARTGAFTTLKAWADRRAPPAWQALMRSSAASRTTFASPATHHLPTTRVVTGSTTDQSERTPHIDDSEQPNAERSQANGGRDYFEGDNSEYVNHGDVCDVRLLFVSGSGLGAQAHRTRKCGHGHVDNHGDSGKESCLRGSRSEGVEYAAAEDMCRALAKELWAPWPQADVVIHTGSQVDIEAAVREALPILQAAEADAEGSDAREEAEELAMDRIREAYRFQWSLPSTRAFLACGSHLMVRGEADLALPHMISEYTLDRDGSTRRCGVQVQSKEMRRGRPKGRLLGMHLSAYVRLTIARLASQAFADYQRQLWDPLSVPAGLSMSDAGCASGGAGIDSVRNDVESYGEGGELQGNIAGVGNEEWHFHAFGETVGLFALDLGQSSTALLRDENAPLLSGSQWASLARAFALKEIQVMILVGDAPFLSDSIEDANAKRRLPSHNARSRSSWSFHGQELLRLLDMLIHWKSTGAVNGEPREAVLVSGGLRYPLESTIYDATTSIILKQIICGSFHGAPLPENGHIEPAGGLADGLSYRHHHYDGHYPVENKTSDQQNELNATMVSTDEQKPRNDKDSPCRNPSCALVECQARGAGLDADLAVRGRVFIPMTWTAWCNVGQQEHSVRSQSSHSQTRPAARQPCTPHRSPVRGIHQKGTSDSSLADVGPPRSACHWTSIASSNCEENEKTRNDHSPMESTEPSVEGVEKRETRWVQVSTLIQEQAAAEIMRNSLEGILDIKDGKAMTLVLAAGCVREMTRRVFNYVAFAYDHAACAKVRVLCPVRPSPIVVHRLLTPKIEVKGNDTVQDHPTPTTVTASNDRKARYGSDEGCGADERGKSEEARAMAGGTLEGGPSARRREDISMLLSSALPFYDDESFAAFFVQVLRASEHLASRFL